MKPFLTHEPVKMQRFTLFILLTLILFPLNACQNKAEPEIQEKPTLEKQAEQFPAIDKVRDGVKEGLDQSEQRTDNAESEISNPSQED